MVMVSLQGQYAWYLNVICYDKPTSAIRLVVLLLLSFYAVYMFCTEQQRLRDLWGRVTKLAPVTAASALFSTRMLRLSVGRRRRRAFSQHVDGCCKHGQRRQISRHAYLLEFLQPSKDYAPISNENIKLFELKASNVRSLASRYYCLAFVMLSLQAPAQCKVRQKTVPTNLANYDTIKCVFNLQ